MSDQNVINSSAPAADAGPIVTPTFSASQLQTMADDLVNRGSMTRDEADAALKADGVEIQAQPSAEQVAYDKQFPRAEKPTDYEMPRIAGDVDAKAAAALDRTARAWLFDAGFDRARGSSMLKEVDRVAQRLASMSESERKSFSQAERGKLARIWGRDTESKLALGRQLVRELDKKTPGLLAMLDETGAGDSSVVVAMLVAQAEILANRPGRK
ncbi:MAG: hypothetical protein HYY78_10475 [Betaproteobacteria bacterium]|nr:hypothetical protein [Betaproteobacteria bacterium]